MPDRQVLLRDTHALLQAEAARRARERLDLDWSAHARPKQLPPSGDWRVWLLLAGRGFGKTRTGSEYIRGLAEQTANRRLALVAPTAADARDIMVEGASGILSVCPNDTRPLYEPSKRRLTWPNGTMATTYSADEPDRLRGPQHDGAWCDELASWRHPEAWDMLMFGLRVGKTPRALVTTTPRPTAIIRELMQDPTTAIVRGSSYENRENLSPVFFDRIIHRYAGTRLGRQEIEAEVLEDVPGALWSHGLIDAGRTATAPHLSRVVVAIDPAVTSGEDADETGIVVAGKDKDQGYVLSDASGRYAPTEWARIAIAAYRAHQADRIVAEVNNGGDMVEATLRMIDPSIPFTKVHATRGKAVRAEPVAALYEQGRIHHVGIFPHLEDQMCTFTADMDRSTPKRSESKSPMQNRSRSPDRVDALVWALSDLLVEPQPVLAFFEATRIRLATRNGIAA